MRGPTEDVTDGGPDNRQRTQKTEDWASFTLWAQLATVSSFVAVVGAGVTD